MKWWNLRLRYITIQRIRIVYSHGYKHDMWVYDLVQDKDGSYSWECYEEDNKIIDIDPKNITSIYVIKKKKVWNVYEKAGTVVETFKPKPKTTEAKLDTEKFAPYRKYYDKLSIKDDIQIVLRDTQKPFIPKPEYKDKVKVVESIYITMTTPEQMVKLRQEIIQLERKIAKLKGKV